MFSRYTLLFIYFLGSFSVVKSQSAKESFFWHSESCDYTGYFAKGKYDTTALRNTSFFLSINSDQTFFPRETNWVFDKKIRDTTNIQELRKRLRDRLSVVENRAVLNFEPWLELKTNSISYRKTMDEKLVLELEAWSNPALLCNDVILDSLSRICVRILVNADVDIVSQTRKLCIDLYSSTLHKNKAHRDYAISLMYERLCSVDSTTKARIELMIIIHNRENIAIQEKYRTFNDKSWWYEREFIKLFDEVEESNVNEP